jgi:hypothetical protein
MLVQPDGRIVVGGGGVVGRLLPDGTPDPSFGRDGWTHLHPAVPSAFSGLILDAAGRIIIGGATREPHPRAQIARLRVDSSGSADADADADGVGDAVDGCPYAFATRAGCPDHGRAVTIDVRTKNLLEGLVSSRSSDCVEGSVVSVLAKRPGRDRPLGRPSNPIEEVIPSDAGERTREYWAITRPAYKGRMYARVRQTEAADEGKCGGARSRTVTLR